ncbi:MAG: hypothetical protein MUC88_20255 [Planctomycetes bacterium]|jgi:hypothetical protein|nr:hypothetical protein [Planctomycetota bacterium]
MIAVDIQLGRGRGNHGHNKPKADRTPPGQKLLDTANHYKMASLNLMSTGRLIENQMLKGRFRYLGNGVKVGDPDRLVCWYKLKDTGTYRLVYGDLSVRNAALEDLLLPVEL